MGIEGLDYKIINIPLARGLKTKDDPRAMEPPGLAICSDARWDDWGGIQTRFPFLSIGNSIFGGGTLSNCRRLEVVNGELVVFTDTQAYTWNAQLSKWLLRATHLAAAITETPRFVTTGDQLDGDRAELNGTVVYAWTDGGVVQAAAMDKTTGSVLVSAFSFVAASSRPRLVATDTKIMMFLVTATGLVCIAIDPADPGFALNNGPVVTVLAAGTFNSYFDVVKVTGQDLVVGACRRVTTTSYTVFTVTSAATPVVTAITKARTCDGPIGIATTPSTGLQTQVIRGNGTNVQGDLLTTSTLADVFTGQAIGTATTSLQQIAVEYSTTLVGGFGVARAFWSRAESATGNDGTVRTNTVTTNNSIGTEATFLVKPGVASRAFAAQGHVFVWVTFARSNEVTGFSGAVAVGVRAQLQNTYFLYRDDGLLVGKAAFDAGGGYSPSVGHLPGVAATSTTGLDFAWCAARRRIVDLGGLDHTGFDARSLLDVALSLDSTRSRRCAVLGKTLYVADSIPWQYDGTGLFEVGFLTYPYQMFLTVGGAGAIPAGVYTYKSTTAWLSAVEEHERSTTAFGAQITATGGNSHAIQLAALNITRKTAALIAPTMEVWRTAIAGSAFFLASGKDPNSLAGTVTNGYIPNNSGAFQVPTNGGGVLIDNLTDAVLTTLEDDTEGGSQLAHLAPPGASIIFATDTRLFLAGIAGSPDMVVYSQLRAQGEVASFNDALRFFVPRGGGDITALAYLNETLIVFRETAIYAVPGQGFDNTGGGQNYGGANRLSADVGALSAESVVLTPMGLMFKSRKGWYLIDRGWNAKYVGGDVAKFDAETVNAAHVLEQYHQVRFVTSGRILVYDYLVDAWSSWSITDAVHACVWNGTYYYLSSSGNVPMAEQATHASGVNYGLDVEIGSVKPAGLQGFVRVDKIIITGEHRGTHALRIRTAFDYRQDASGNAVYTDEVYWTPSPGVVGSPFQVVRGTSQGRCEAIKVRITASSTAKNGTPPTTEAIKLTGLALKIGFRRTINKRLPAAQKT